MFIILPFAVVFLCARFTILFATDTYCHPTTRSCFMYEPNDPETVNEYHHYLIGLIKELMNMNFKANFALGYRIYQVQSSNSEITKTVRINYSVEHTLVSPGGRTVGSKDMVGTVPVTYLNKSANDFYLVREVQFDKHLRGDIVLEYR